MTVTRSRLRSARLSSGTTTRSSAGSRASLATARSSSSCWSLLRCVLVVAPRRAGGANDEQCRRHVRRMIAQGDAPVGARSRSRSTRAARLADARRTIDRICTPVAKLVLLWQAALWGGAAVAFWVKHVHGARARRATSAASVAMINAMGVGAKVVLWILIVITALKSVFAIESHRGSPASASAASPSRSPCRTSSAICSPRWRSCSTSRSTSATRSASIRITGTVEHIGLKTTRIRSITGEQIIIGNSDLLKSRLRNFRRMYQRRVLFNLDVTFDTPPAVARQTSAASSNRSLPRRARSSSTGHTSRASASRRSASRRCTTCSIPTTRCTWTFSRRSTSRSSPLRRRRT